MECLITSDPDIFGGKPVLRGTRISVEFLLKLLRSHIPISEILEDYPSIKRDLLEQFLQLTQLFQINLHDLDLSSYFQQVQKI